MEHYCDVLNNMDDGVFKNVMQQQTGNTMSDDQIKQMKNMMNPSMLKMMRNMDPKMMNDMKNM